MKEEGKRSLLVGINTYHDRKVTNLSFCVNDVTSTYRILTDPDRGGFTQDNCLLMTDKSRKRSMKPIGSNIMSSIKALSEMASSDDYILFFFSGHGIEEKGGSYLLPSDARINILDKSAVPLDWIRETMGRSRARAKVMILDACHTGAIKGKSESGRMTKGLHDAISQPPEGFAILSSCRMNQVSYEMPGKKRSVFTYFLNEGLMGAADSDSDGKITVPDASSYATDRTIEWARKEGVEQSPHLWYSTVRDVVLVHVPKRGQKIASEKVEGIRVQVPAVLEKMQLVVNLKKDNDWKGPVWAHQLCGFLLSYFDSDQIVGDGKRFRFPCGSFYVSGDRPAINLTYGKSERETVDRFLSDYSSSRIEIDSLVYLMPKNVAFDFVKIARAQVSNVGYDPAKQVLWGSLGEPIIESEDEPIQVTFQNPKQRGKRASITVDSPTKYFSGKLYQKLNPEALLRFLGDIYKGP